ncbi:MAG: hypothetical protein AB1425_05135 [Actinomycetota bacterium]
MTITMFVLLWLLIAVGALLALASAVSALRAWLRYRRARLALHLRLDEEVARLARRTGEVEERLSTLEIRAARLPVRIAELQQSLATLRVLTDALSTTLLQARRVLSYPALKTLSAARLERILPLRFPR